MQTDHRVSGNSVWISVEGLRQPLKVLHATDSHISETVKQKHHLMNTAPACTMPIVSMTEGRSSAGDGSAVAERVDLIA